MEEALLKIKSTLLAVLFAAVFVALAAYQRDREPRFATKKTFDATMHEKSGGKSSDAQILYHGGPVMLGPNSVYVIYYGTTFAQTTQPIVNDFLYGLANDSPEYGVNGTYNQPPGTKYIPLSYTFVPPSPGVNAGSSYSVFLDAGSQGTQLGSSAIPNIVANALNNGLAHDSNGVYLVVTAPDIKVSGFCNSYCAYHNHGSLTLSDNTVMDVRYALIPDPSQRCNSCNGGVAVYGDTATPNGDIGADTMTDDIMHELSETVTDPDISAWYTKGGAEAADLCNFYYGPLQTGSTLTLGTVNTGTNSAGATFHYNAELITPAGTTRFYLIQQIWKNASPGACSAGQ